MRGPLGRRVGQEPLQLETWQLFTCLCCSGRRSCGFQGPARVQSIQLHSSPLDSIDLVFHQCEGVLRSAGAEGIHERQQPLRLLSEFQHSTDYRSPVLGFVRSLYALLKLRKTSLDRSHLLRKAIQRIDIARVLDPFVSLAALRRRLRSSRPRAHRARVGGGHGGQILLQTQFAR